MANLNVDQVEHYLRDVHYPARKKEIIGQARKEGAHEDVPSVLRELQGEEYRSHVEVNLELNSIIQKQLEIGPR